jgi:hypothetical protein
MNTKIFTSVIVLAVVLAAPAFGGGKCKYDTQACLDKMIEHYESKGYAGVELDTDEETGVLTIKVVVADTPAAAAGFRIGDQLVAINGLVLAETDEEKLYKAWQAMTPGTKATYTRHAHARSRVHRHRPEIVPSCARSGPARGEPGPGRFIHPAPSPLMGPPAPPVRREQHPPQSVKCARGHETPGGDSP